MIKKSFVNFACPVAPEDGTVVPFVANNRRRNDA